jgi:uncharacterized protein
MKAVSAAFIAVICLAIRATLAPAEAASFNCAKAKTADEIAICNTPHLSDLDTEMATLYGVRMQIPMLMGARGVAQDEQRAFLVQRGACGGNISCIQQTRVRVDAPGKEGGRCGDEPRQRPIFVYA